MDMPSKTLGLEGIWGQIGGASKGMKSFFWDCMGGAKSSFTSSR